MGCAGLPLRDLWECAVAASVPADKYAAAAARKQQLEVASASPAGKGKGRGKAGAVKGQVTVPMTGTGKRARAAAFIQRIMRGFLVRRNARVRGGVPLTVCLSVCLSLSVSLSLSLSLSFLTPPPPHFVVTLGSYDFNRRCCAQRLA